MNLTQAGIRANIEYYHTCQKNQEIELERIRLQKSYWEDQFNEISTNRGPVADLARQRQTTT